jgi:hypothetical protein
VDQHLTPKRPCRDLLDWFATQVDRLDEHARQVDAHADRLTAAELAAQHRALTEAYGWLADQAAQALAQRGLPAAA